MIGVCVIVKMIKVSFRVKSIFFNWNIDSMRNDDTEHGF